MTSDETRDTKTIDEQATGTPEEGKLDEQEPQEQAADTAADEQAAPEQAGQDAGTDGPAVGARAPRAKSSRAVVAGAFAFVSAGLGLSSLTGTSLSGMLRTRKEIIGQIEASTGGGGDQVEAVYGAPWHTAAVVDGIVALIAALIGGALLAVYARSADASPWIKSLALGGVVLGVLGMFVAGGMYLDLFGSQPTLPPQPQMPGTGG